MLLIKKTIILLYISLSSVFKMEELYDTPWSTDAAFLNYLQPILVIYVLRGKG